MSSLFRRLAILVLGTLLIKYLKEYKVANTIGNTYKIMGLSVLKYFSSNSLKPPSAGWYNTYCASSTNAEIILWYLSINFSSINSFIPCVYCYSI